MRLQLRISDTDATPPYEQLYQQIAAGIRAGTLAEGYRLPTMRVMLPRWASAKKLPCR